jgi:hypothetical protein
MYTEQSKHHTPTFFIYFFLYLKNILKSDKLSVLLNVGNVHHDLA